MQSLLTRRTIRHIAIQSEIATFLLFAALLAAIGAPAGAQSTGNSKVTLCHRPPDNPSNVRVITVSAKAVAEHLAHGDGTEFGGACYVHVPQDVNGFQAEQACIDDFGGHLTSIHSQAEDDFLSALADPNAVGGNTPWIGGLAPTVSGLFDAGPAAAYAWTDGSPWDFQNWRTSTFEPNASGPAPAGTQFWPNTNGALSGWNDVPRSAMLVGYICKFQP